jgi:glycine/D-amino acid oxidase-like deaminating enzyme
MAGTGSDDGGRMRNHAGYVSLWLDEALGAEQGTDALAPVPPTADVVIVGGGFTGLWTAIRLREREPDCEVCLVEAAFCGYGASGRNGGIAATSWAKFPAMERLYGRQSALELGGAIEKCLQELPSFCEREGIDAEIRFQGGAWVATNRAQLGAWERTLEALRAAGHDHYRPLSADEARERTGSHAALGGVTTEVEATLQPGRLARGLRRVAIERGVTVCEDARMLGIDARAPIQVRTSRGSVRADRVVLAMNAWAAGIRSLKPHLFVTSSDIVATSPLPPEALTGGLGRGVAIDDSRRLILYWRSTPSGRIVFGKGGGFMSIDNRVGRRFTGRSALSDQVESRLRFLYPELPDSAVEYSWNGPIDYSVTGMPYFGPCYPGRDDIIVGAGYSGMGVVQTMLGGKILASLALGSDDAFAASPLTREWERHLPPEPLRSLGAPIVKAAIRRREMMDDAGMDPDPFTRFVAGLDPTASPNQT